MPFSSKLSVKSWKRGPRASKTEERPTEIWSDAGSDAWSDAVEERVRTMVVVVKEKKVVM